MCISDLKASISSSNVQPPGVSFAPCLLTSVPSYPEQVPRVSEPRGQFIIKQQIFSEHLVKSVLMQTTCEGKDESVVQNLINK